MVDRRARQGKDAWKGVVARIRALATPAGRARHGTCSVEGTRLCERALRAGARLEHAVADARFLRGESPRSIALRDELRVHGCEVLEVPLDVMETLTQGRSLGGVVAVASTPPRRSLAEVLAEETRARILLACTELSDPGNAGALVRTAHAAGARALLCAGAVDPFHPKAVRTSMGSVFRLPILSWRDARALLDELRAAGVRTVGAVTRGGVAPSRLPRAPRSATATALLVGSEAFGLHPAEAAALDERVTIPMAAGVDSFSVNAAAAVLLYELTRGREG